MANPIPSAACSSALHPCTAISRPRGHDSTFPVHEGIAAPPCSPPQSREIIPNGLLFFHRLPLSGKIKLISLTVHYQTILEFPVMLALTVHYQGNSNYFSLMVFSISLMVNAPSGNFSFPVVRGPVCLHERNPRTVQNDL